MQSRKRSRSSAHINQPFKRPRTIVVQPVVQGVNRNRPTLNRLPVGTEYKYNDVSWNTDATATETVVQLTSIAQGTTNLTRNGNKIQLKSVALRIAYNAESIAQNVRIRVMLVSDRQSNGTAYTGVELLTSVTLVGASNITAFGRFHVLWDKVLVLNATTSTAGCLQVGFIKKFIKIPASIRLVNYNVTTASIPYSNGLSLFYFSDIASGATDADFFGTARVKFVG